LNSLLDGQAGLERTVPTSFPPVAAPVRREMRLARGGDTVRNTGMPPERILRGDCMILLGAILFVIGLIASIYILWVVGLILLAIGVVLALLGRSGRPVGGRSHWY